MAAYTIGSREWFVFAGIFLVSALGLLPGAYALCVSWTNRLGKKQRSLREALAQYSQTLVPLGLMAWIAFTVSFAFVKFTYVLPVISDPLGWGWNLLGLHQAAGVGQASPFSLFLQIVILAVGLFWTARVNRRISESWRQAAPMIVFSSLFSLAMLWLLVG
jgi:hypothetical protein